MFWSMLSLQKNLGTNIDMAPVVVAFRPGFTAPKDVHAVIETKRGHYLEQMITNGIAIPNTGIPGMKMGYTTERVLRAPAHGKLETASCIGDRVKKGDLISKIK